MELEEKRRLIYSLGEKLRGKGRRPLADNERQGKQDVGPEENPHSDLSRQLLISG